MAVSKVMYSSASDEWATPIDLLRQASAAMGGIDLDPADSLNNPNPFAKKCYNLQTISGLDAPWVGKIYLNPPFSEIQKWMEKLRKDYLLNYITEAIALVPARTDTQWFQDFAPVVSGYCFLKGRVKYIPPPPLPVEDTGDEVEDADPESVEPEKRKSFSAPFPSVFLYVGYRPMRFRDTVETDGIVLVKPPKYGTGL